MHTVDPTTDAMVRSVLAYAENRLRMSPVPLDRGTRSPAELYAALDGVLREAPRQPDEVLGVYSSVIAPSIISADSPRFLGFIPAAPTKASLLFDMLISCASIQGISWLEASGAIAAENTVLRLIGDEAGFPDSAGGCFVSGGSAGNLSALAVARETGKRRLGDAAAGRRLRVVVGEDAHSSIVNTLRLLEMDALVVSTPDHRLTGSAVQAAIDADGAADADVVAVVCTSGTTNAGIIDDLAGVGALAQAHDWWFHVDGAYGGSGIFARSLRAKYDGIERADSFILDPHKWLFTPFDCCALIYRRSGAGAGDPHAGRLLPGRDPRCAERWRGRVEPDRLRLPPHPPCPGASAVVLARRLRGAGVPGRDRGRRPTGAGHRGTDRGDAAPRADPRARPRGGVVPAARLDAGGLRRLGRRAAQRGRGVHSPVQVGRARPSAGSRSCTRTRRCGSCRRSSTARPDPEPRLYGAPERHAQRHPELIMHSGTLPALLGCRSA